MNERGGGRELTGFIIILIGFGFLMNTMGILPSFPFIGLIQRFWLPALFIAIGALLLSRRGGQEGIFGGAFFVLFGLLFLMGSMNFWNFSYRRWIGPAILIWIGVTFLMRNPRQRFERRTSRGSPGRPNAFGMDPQTDSSDYIHATVILGGLNRRCLSQKFRGGDLTAIMGGGKIDLREAQIQDGEAVLDVFTLMGGLEIQVPPGWIIEPRFTPILGGFADRTNHQTQGTQRLAIHGTTVMGGVTISN
jgi:predicted membrane protein